MESAKYDLFFDAPVGRYTATASTVVWCASRSLCGAVLWGRPTEEETRAILALFDQYDRHMAATFDIILDTRGVESVDPRGLALLFAWLHRRKDALLSRISLQASVIREGPVGFLLTGLLPVVGRTHPYRIFTEPAEAFLAVSHGGDALCAEVERLTEQLRGLPRELSVLRARLSADVHADLEEVSRALGISARSLQRALTRHGTSFHREVNNARFALAQELLRSTDDKLVAISGRVGVSERSLTLLFRSRTGLAPAEWRRRHRA